MEKLVTIYGGSGFVGRYIVQRMARAGWRVRVACRHPNEAIFVRSYGVPGQVEPVLCNVRDQASVRSALQDADAVVNCVGILNAIGKNRFDAIQAKAPARIACLAAAEGVKQFVHLSAIGADGDSNSLYARTKAQGEEAVLAAFPTAVILRPSVIFGHEDQFFNRFARMAVHSPALPLVGACTKFQPVYVDDVAQAAAQAAMGQAKVSVYELGGPEVASFRQFMVKMLCVIRCQRPIFDMPFWVARLMAGTFDALQMLTLGLFENKMLTLDQLRNLAHDNVVSVGVGTFADLGIIPVAVESILPEYLWRYRPSGQYATTIESAEDLNRS